MRTLAAIDFAIIGLYIVIALAIGFYYTRKASTSMEHFFLSGRSMPWWLLGISMAATNFAIDTPLSMSKFVANNGVPGAWYHWSGGFAGIAATFFFSRLWRRAKVITDNELIELRYSGKRAAFLRLFKGVYFGLFINCFILAWVFNALVKVSTTLTPWDTTSVLFFFGTITLIYTITSGFYGVVMTDFIQYIFAIGGSVLLAILSVRHVGGIEAMISKLDTIHPGEGFTDLTPHMFNENPSLPFSTFLILILVKWWAHKYSDGGGKHIQRMSSAINERHAVFGTFFYSTFTFIIALWPWIITGLCGAIVFPDNPDPETNYPGMMLKVLPAGVLGLCVMGLIGAFMSTVDTHLNLGASYFINDIYKRFIRPDADDRHYVFASRIAILLIMGIAIALSLQITSVASAWLFVLSFASGAGLTWILRWFWWRVNAWTEVSAMFVSAIVSTTIKLVWPEMPFTTALLWIIGITTPIFLAVTFATSPTDENTLKSFYQRVRPSKFGWSPIISKFDLAYTPYFKRSVVNFVIGAVLLLLVNLGVGMLILRSATIGLTMITISVGLVLFLIKRIQDEPTEEDLVEHDAQGASRAVNA